MSQYDFGNLSSPLPGTTFFDTHLEPWRDALHSNHSGSSAPSYIASGGHWLDTTSATSWILKYYDGTDSIESGTVDVTNNLFINTRYMPAGTAAAPGVSFSTDTDTGLFRSSANVMGVAANGSAVGYFGSSGLALGTSTFVSQSKLTVAGSISCNSGDSDLTSGSNRAFMDLASSAARFGSAAGGGSAVTTEIWSNGSKAIDIDSSGLIVARGLINAKMKVAGSTGTIIKSSNVTSVVRNSTGNYTVTLTNATPDANATLISCGDASGSASTITAKQTSTTSITVWAHDGSGTAADPTFWHLSVLP